MMKCFQYDNPAFKIKVLDYTYTSQPSINTALPLKSSNIKTFLFLIGVVLTFGFLWLLTKWSAKKKAIFRYNICSLDEATHFLIHDEDTESVMTLVDGGKKYQMRLKRQCMGFIYHDRTYIYVEEKEVFVPVRYQELGLHLDKLKKDKFLPFSEEERKELLQYYGENVMKLRIQSKLDIFIQEMLTPYEVFQTYGIILWICEEYYIFAFILLGYSLYTYWTNSKDIMQNQQKLAFESYFDMQSKVLIKDCRENETEGEKEVQLCKNALKLDEHKSEILKGSFNGVQEIDKELDHHIQDIEHQLELTVVKKSERRQSREVKNQQNQLINSRNVRFQTISSHKLVPGDLIILNEGDIVPCDCILLRGEALVNQKYSTGENYLVRKQQIQNFTYVKENQRSFLLYLGTEIVKIKNMEQGQKRKRSDNDFSSIEQSMRDHKIDYVNQIVCLVTQTNYNTLRGKFLRAIKYQNRQQQSFFKQTIYFIYIIIILSTIVYFIYLGVIGPYTNELKMFLIYIDLLITAIPPTLPAILNVGIDFVQRRLKTHGINCVIPKSVLTGGKVDTLVLKGEGVFGKQFQIHSAAIGTKGERGFGLTFTSVNQFQSYNDSDAISYSDIHDLRKKRNQRDQFYKTGTFFITAISCCHTLQFFKKSIEGPLFQKKIFQFSQCRNLAEDQFQTLNYRISVLKIIRFKTKHMKLGVLVNLRQKKEVLQEFNPVKRSEASYLQHIDHDITIKNDRKGSQNSIRVAESQPQMKRQTIDKRYFFIKGSPEIILRNCVKDSYPINAMEYIVDMAEKGFILHCYAMREYHTDSQQNFDYQEYINHTQFTFLGFVIMQQIRSQQNQEAIRDLNEAGVKTIFISEQRQLQTTSKAIFNGICNKNELLLCDITKNRDKISCKGHIEWQSSSNELISQFITQFQDFGKGSKVSISSGLFQQIFMKRQIGAAQNIFDKSIIYNKMDLKIQKNLYNQLEKRKRVSCAVGNGGNLSECSTLSLELQRSESSLLSSFYTNTSSLKSIVTCLRICRAGLSTNFHGFSMMILFSLIQFTTVVILNCNYETLTNDQMLYQDLFITFPIFVTLNLTLPATKLSKQLPPSSFFSFRHICSMVGQLLIQFLAQLGFILFVLSIDYFHSLSLQSKQYYIANGDFRVGSELSLALFVLSNNLYLGIVLSTSVSKPFRKPFYTNPFYTINLVLLWCYNTFLVIFPRLSPSEMRSKNLNEQSQFILVLALVVGNLVMVVMYMFQNMIVFLWSVDNPFRKKNRADNYQLESPRK